MDKAEFIKEAPMFYALAIATVLRRSGEPISRNTIASEYTIQNDDEFPDGPIRLLGNNALWKRAIDWLQSEEMIIVKSHAFGPQIYEKSPTFGDAWDDLQKPEGIFRTFVTIRDGGDWLHDALRGILDTQEALSVTEADFIHAEKPRRIAEEMEPFTDPPDKFDGLTVDDSVDSIVSWFFENFEDAAEGRGFDSNGAGIWGGPYKTRDIIENVFADTATNALIDAAVAQVRREGDNWMPKTRGPHYINEESEASEDPAELYAEMVRQIASLERIVPKFLIVPHHGIGHNNPPEAMDAGPLDADDAKEIAEALATLKAQPVVPDKPQEAKKAIATIDSKRGKVKDWLAKQGDEFMSAAVKEAGKEFGKWAPRAFWLVMVDKMIGLSQAALLWLHTIGY